jgi:uncharacterized membrane protein YdfJ with MMPL/SSD domain
MRRTPCLSLAAPRRIALAAALAACALAPAQAFEIDLGHPDLSLRWDNSLALGVGIGVDYALDLLSVQLAQQREGLPLRAAYAQALTFTGKVVALVGITLAAGVLTWALSPIKFQADMGILLAFMFLWNMVGAVVLIPALSAVLMRGDAAAERATSQAASAAA